MKTTEENDLRLAKAQANAAGSLLLEVQQESIAKGKALTMCGHFIRDYKEREPQEADALLKVIAAVQSFHGTEKIEDEAISDEVVLAYLRTQELVTIGSFPNTIQPDEINFEELEATVVEDARRVCKAVLNAWFGR